MAESKKSKAGRLAGLYQEFCDARSPEEVQEMIRLLDAKEYLEMKVRMGIELDKREVPGAGDNVLVVRWER